MLMGMEVQSMATRGAQRRAKKGVFSKADAHAQSCGKAAKGDVVAHNAALSVVGEMR
jgi:hypothetical protein